MNPVLFVTLLVILVLGLYIIWGNRERWHIKKSTMQIFLALSALVVIYLIYLLTR